MWWLLRCRQTCGCCMTFMIQLARTSLWKQVRKHFHIDEMLSNWLLLTERISVYFLWGGLSVLNVCSFAIGKCYKVPPGLDDSGKRKRKGPAALQDFWAWYTGTCKLCINTCWCVYEDWIGWNIPDKCLLVADDPPEPRLKNGPTYTGKGGSHN